ncbi:hypothetical protein [Brevibacillus fulvus]|uniref:Pilus assembly protein CpaE n=1 Tax=Brevibacillus fulvus TaxID=1125967 RepID=A0A939BR51_9BACL|nr:hypothetical protein [Brevibacillus fulvus]MBM7592305.1 hypothetical protein [Brevibacillus fulvus]
MKLLVAYPSKTLVNAFMPAHSEVLVGENEEIFYKRAAAYTPEAVILFTEMFDTPVWQWMPTIRQLFPVEVPVIIVPLQHEEELAMRIYRDLQAPNVYLLRASLTQTEIRKQISLLLGLDKRESPTDSADEQRGKVYGLLSHGSAGVTTFCVNYPVLLGKRYPEKRIAIIDMNHVKPDLSSFFKLDQHQIALFRPDLMEQKFSLQRDWRGVFQQHRFYKNLYYASAAYQWGGYELSNFLTALKRNFSHIFLDWGYCFPETEGLYRLLRDSDKNLFFVRADPSNLEHAVRWMARWKQRKVETELFISHVETGTSDFRSIYAKFPVYGAVPRIPTIRMVEAQRSKSILVEEVFPPKSYVHSLNKIIEKEESEEVRRLTYENSWRKLEQSVVNE